MGKRQGMGLLGTIIGGGIGFMVGGPLGALLGGAIGSNFGDINGGGRPHPGARTRDPRFEGQRGYGSIPRDSYGNYNPLAAQQTFMVALISLAAKVAKADGRVTPEEVASFDRFLRDNMSMDAQDRKIAAKIFNEARDSDTPAEEYARQIRHLMGGQSYRMRDLITLLMSIAMADGRLHEAEDRLIRTVATTLGLSAADYEAATAAFGTGGSIEDAYKTLGLSRQASDDEVKRTYRKLAKEYHPDVLASKGMGEDFTKFAAEKMRAINGAYDTIKEARGM